MTDPAELDLFDNSETPEGSVIIGNDEDQMFDNSYSTPIANTGRVVQGLYRLIRHGDDVYYVECCEDEVIAVETEARYGDWNPYD